MANSSKDIQFIELKDMISELNTTIKTLTEALNKQQAENDNLKAELAWFRQKYFGASSERRVDDVAGQLNLFDNLPEDEKPVELIEPEVVHAPKKSRKKKPALAERIDYSPQTRYYHKMFLQTCDHMDKSRFQISYLSVVVNTLCVQAH